MKKDQYFNLEVNLLNDDNIACMMSEMNAAEALGIYVMLLLHLRTKDAYEASCKPVLLKAMARRYDVDEVAVERVLREFDLFELDEERQMFRSSYLDRVMKSLEEKRKMDIENGKKGGRPKKVAKSAETPVSKGRKPTENQKRREEESKEEKSKEEESKEKESKEKESKGSVSVVNNNRSNIETPSSLVSRLADEGNHCPLQPVLPWEKLVDQLSTFQSYMELAGQHSGLGKLFVDHQKLILEIFKKHIRLYDKGAGLLFPEDVKRYFSNYIAAGSVTCRTLRETLLKELENTVDKDVNRFESVVDGRRTYLGHLIPVDAPPRPDASAVWDDVKKRWAH